MATLYLQTEHHNQMLGVMMMMMMKQWKQAISYGARIYCNSGSTGSVCFPGDGYFQQMSFTHNCSAPSTVA